jgi:hypothetical protein
MHYFLLYIDPGSGSYLVQVIVAGVLGVVFFFKTVKAYIFHFFRRLFHRDKKAEDNGPQG